DEPWQAAAVALVCHRLQEGLQVDPASRRAGDAGPTRTLRRGHRAARHRRRCQATSRCPRWAVSSASRALFAPHIEVPRPAGERVSNPCLSRVTFSPIAFVSCATKIVQTADGSKTRAEPVLTDGVAAGRSVRQTT